MTFYYYFEFLLLELQHFLFIYPQMNDLSFSK